ncbi:MAG: hypothetical protein LBM02_09005 [Lachnospiraceae bacterium]|jgi:hypothetical protein|nr:hypothetical protein [Lachnospiraceae bacterium]
MGYNKNDEKRDAIRREIIKIEEKQSDVRQYKRSFEKAISNFHLRYKSLARASEKAVYDSISHGNKGAANILDVDKGINIKIDRLVDAQFHELDSGCRRAIRKMEDEKEDLIRERNHLQWE